jgi:hypothetical protein
MHKLFVADRKQSSHYQDYWECECFKYKLTPTADGGISIARQRFHTEKFL